MHSGSTQGHGAHNRMVSSITDVMDLSKSSGGRAARRLRGLCVHHHQCDHGSSLHRKKTSKIFQDCLPNSPAQERPKETQKNTQQDRFRLAGLLRIQPRTYPGRATIGSRKFCQGDIIFLPKQIRMQLCGSSGTIQAQSPGVQRLVQRTHQGKSTRFAYQGQTMKLIPTDTSGPRP